ncbi:MAG: two-component system sensor histidine kinase CreC [Planctomycetota bacterium]|nr:MAG: two-component system sensor histidine kinase CreC [Planctomycetota bacterium]
MKFRLRILLIFIIGLGSYIAYYSVWVVGELQPHYLDVIEDDLNDFGLSYANIISNDSSENKINYESLKIAFDGLHKKPLNIKISGVMKKKAGLFAYVTDANGIILYHSKDSTIAGQNYSKWNDVFLTLKGQYGARTTLKEVDWEEPRGYERFENTSAIMFVGFPIKKNGKIIGCVSFAKRISVIWPYVAMAQNRIIIVGLIAFSMAMVFTILFLIWILMPMKKLIDYSKSLESKFGSSVVDNISSDEVSKITKQMTVIVDELDSKLYVESCLQSLVHELKSPVAAIQGAAEILEDPLENEKKKKFVINIKLETKRIAKIIDNFLALSSLELKGNTDNFEKVNIARLVNKLLIEFEQQVAGGEITFINSVKADSIVSGDTFLLEQSIRNIVQNAINFSEGENEISISSKILNMQLNLTFSDRGVGIPTFGINRVFEKFYSLSRPSGEKSSLKKGTGLGLSFVQEVMRLHNGEITIKNQVEGGVEVVVRLPI